MLGDQTTKDYFDASKSITLRPLISAEWNYNSIYEPYVTYTGDGINYGNNLTNPSYWKVSTDSLRTTISQSLSSEGKITSAFPSPRKALKITKTRYPLYDTSKDSADTDLSKSNWYAAIETAVNVPVKEGNNCYKIVFYAKAYENNLISVSATATHPNLNANIISSTSKEIDDVTWTKFEILFGVRPKQDSGKIVDDSYSSINLHLDFTNTTYYPDSFHNTWGVLIDRFEIYQITYFDYMYGDLWDSSSVFRPMRPGESYVQNGVSGFSGNDYRFELPTNFRKVITGALSYDNNGNATNWLSNPTGNDWNAQMPANPLVYSPRTLMGYHSNPLYKNGMVSPFSQYKYLVTDREDSAVGASYEELLKINKIVLKFNIAESKPDSLAVYLYRSTDGQNQIVDTIQVKSSDINDAGVCILYYHPDATNVNLKWTTRQWSTDSYPITDKNNFGEFVISNTSPVVLATQEINKIVVKQSSAALANADYSTPLVKDSVRSELKRMHVIEISPRLELDMSSLVQNFNVQKELDNKSNIVPISAISANSASIAFTNIPWPRPGISNDPLFLFSNNSTESPLKNMFVKNVKFYINYYIPSLSKIVPAGVFYADNWDTKDIETTSVSCFDITKHLQLLPVNDYVAAGGQELFKVITNLLDSSGFTDYDYDQLADVCRNNQQKITLNYFFADSKNKTVFDVLRELFTAYQVGAYIDEYGVMKFLNLSNINRNNGSTLSLDDTNIATKGYDERVKVKIGKVNFRYKTPQITRTIDFTNDPATVAKYTKYTDFTELTPQPNQVWKEDTNDFITFNYLNESIKSKSQHFFDLAISDFDSVYHGMALDNRGHAIIEGEIVSLGGLQFRFSDSLGKAPSTDLIVTSSNDLQAAISQYSYNKGVSSNINYRPTGRIVNVKRGVFNTPIKEHIVMKTKSDVDLKFERLTQSYDSSTSLYSSKLISSDNMQPDKIGFIPVDQKYNIKTFMVAKGSKNSYSTYSTKFQFNKTTTQQNAGLFMFLQRDSNNNTIGTTYYVELEKAQTQDNSDSHDRGARQSSLSIAGPYYLSVYSIDLTGLVRTDLLKKIDVTQKVLEAYSNQPTDEYDINNEVINLRAVVTDKNKLVVFINKQQVVFENNNISIPANSSGEFGFFTFGIKNNSTSLNLFEIYACENPIVDKDIYYHFQTTDYLNSLLISNHPKPIRYYMTQSRPEVIGLKIYDVQFAPAPVLGAYPAKVSYLYVERPAYSNVPAKNFFVKENALAYSDVISSGFRGSFALVNASPHLVFLKQQTDQVTTDFWVQTQFFLSVGTEKNVQKIIDTRNNEVVEIQTDWVQSDLSAMSIANNIAQAIDNFSKDTALTLFGNPLIQIGDVAEINYSLMNIPSQKYFVQSVTQTFNNGLVTDLILNRITYAGGSPGSPTKAINYVPPKNGVLSSITPPISAAATSTVIPDTIDVNSITTQGNIKLSWTPVKNATSYRLSLTDVPRTLQATLTSGQNSVTLTSGTTSKMKVGESISKISGTGAFGTNAKVASIVNITQFTTDVSHATSGSILFTDPAPHDSYYDAYDIPLRSVIIYGQKNSTYEPVISPFIIPTGTVPGQSFEYDPYKDGPYLRIQLTAYNDSSNNESSNFVEKYYLVQPNTKNYINIPSVVPVNNVRPKLHPNDPFVQEGVLNLFPGRWDASTVDRQPENLSTDGKTQYEYTWYIYNGATWEVLEDWTNETSLEYSVEEKTDYKCSVIATNEAGSSEEIFSDVCSVAVNYPLTQLEKVTNLQAYVGYDDKVVVTWTDAAYPAEKFIVYYKNNEDFGYIPITTIASGVQRAILDSTYSNKLIFVESADIYLNATNRAKTDAIVPTAKNMNIDGLGLTYSGGTLSLDWENTPDALSYIIKIYKTPTVRQFETGNIPTAKSNISLTSSYSFTPSTYGYTDSDILSISITPAFANNQFGNTLTVEYDLSWNFRDVGGRE